MTGQRRSKTKELARKALAASSEKQTMAGQLRIANLLEQYLLAYENSKDDAESADNTEVVATTAATASNARR